MDCLGVNNLANDRISNDKAINHRGKSLQDFMDSNGFILINGRSMSDTPGQFTFGNANGNSTVDLVWVNIIGLHLIRDMWVESVITKSDHWPVTLELNLPFSNPSIEDQDLISAARSRLVWSPSQSSSFKMAMLHSPNVTGDFATSTSDRLYDNLCEGIELAASSCGLLKPLPHKRSQLTPNKPWFDSECLSSKKSLKKLLSLCKLNQQNKFLWLEYYALKNSHFQLLKSRKLTYDMLLLEKFKNIKSHSDFWGVVKTVNRPPSQPQHIPLSKWAEFLNSIYGDKQTPQAQYSGIFDEDLDAEITLEEVQKSLHKIKNGKSADSDGIPNEFLKVLPHNWLLYIVALFNKIYNSGETPADWSRVIIFMLHKKGDPLEPGNYRGIALVNCLTKVFTQILLDRIRAWATRHKLIPVEQAGFEPGRSCADNVFSLIALHQLQSRFKNSVSYILFIDFKRAFDSIPHAKLWDKLHNLKLSSKILNLLINFYSKIKVQVRGNKNSLSPPIVITEGVLRGEILSPILFSLYISDIVLFF
ncbi:uncharacterized protein LOC130667344 [Microplitis mediator]|uniref:uncharacterized protein LOC130667344 n=1 Tax=Microplitis mediator TaxID=375433 RepID=UPI00255303D5|nr:uncharacterized protein LOC130667344 [Microplitis mediator]